MDLHLSQSRFTLGDEMEHQIGPDLVDQPVHGPAVPDIGLEVLRTSLPGPGASATMAHADQAAWAPGGQLSHQGRADAARPAGHQYGRTAKAFGQLRLGQAKLAPADGEEPRMFLSGAVASAFHWGLRAGRCA